MNITELAMLKKMAGGGGGGASGGGIIDVTELPTNPTEGAVYRVTEPMNVDVYIGLGGMTISLFDLLASQVSSPVITYSVVDSLPTSPNVSNLQSLSPLYVYICEDVPYFYGDAGNGEMWLTLSAMLSATMGTTFPDMGYVEHLAFAIGVGIYVTYKKDVLAVVEKSIYGYDGGWENRYNDVVGLLTKTIKNLKIPDGVVFIGENAFSHCSSLTSITIPDSVMIIGSYAFSSCSSLTSITIPDSVTEIGGCAFEHCSSLTSIALPDGFTKINPHTFWNCGQLTTISIPDSVTSIEQCALRDCINLTRIIFRGTKEQWKAITKHPDWDSCSAVGESLDYIIYCTDGTIAKDGTET